VNGRREARLARLRGELVEGDRTIELDCPGVIHSRDGSGSGLDGSGPAIGLGREVTIVLSDGGLICVASAREAGGERHSAEETIAAISHPGGYLDFEQVLLSTEYDPAGRQRRATLELWPASDEIAALHGAGSVISGCTAKVGPARINTALFRWALDGHSGLGRYEIRTEQAPAEVPNAESEVNA